jgi:ABC-type transport system involved in multi-copper enzyme maturation permease subunit
MLGIVKSEWTKFRSSPWCMLGALAAILITPIVVVVMMSGDATLAEAVSGGGAALQSTLGSGAELTSLQQSLIANCLRATMLAQAGIVVAAAALFGQEYENSSLRTTFLAVPNRTKVLAAKWLLITIIAILAAMISGLLGLLVGVIQYGCNPSFFLLTKFAGLVLPATASWIILAWISAGLSVLTKSLIVPIAIMLPLLLGLSQLLHLFVEAAKFLPDLAAINLFLVPPTPTYLDAWLGVIVQLTWAVTLGALAIHRTLRRDVR